MARHEDPQGRHVLVTGGKDRGKTGRVLRTEPRKRRVYVEGLNIVKRHQRPRSVKDTQKGAEAGGIIEKEGPIHVSNVMLLDPTDNKPTRVGVAGQGRQARALREAHRDRGRRSGPKMEATVTEAQRAAPPPRLRELYASEVAPS